MPFANFTLAELASIQDYSSSDRGKNDTPFLHYVCNVVEKVLCRHALRQTEASDAQGRAQELATEVSIDPGINTCLTPVSQQQQQQQVAMVPSAEERNEGGNHDARTMPFPSLFLHSPASFMRHTWASIVEKKKADGGGGAAAEATSATTVGGGDQQNHTVEKERAQTRLKQKIACTLRSTLPPPPPAYLLSSPPPPPKEAVSGRETGKRGMYELDLLRSDVARARTVVVLQSELGIAISVDYSNNDDGNDEPDGSEANSNEDDRDVFLTSVDATSCVLVACRVTLHPYWVSILSQLHNLSTNSTTHKSRGAGAAAAASVEEEEDLVFACLCSTTRAAAMAHFDTASGTAAQLHAMVWEAAVPAWLRAVGEHCHHNSSSSSSSSKVTSGVAAAAAATSSDVETQQMSSVHEEDVAQGIRRLQRILAFAKTRLATQSRGGRWGGDPGSSNKNNSSSNIFPVAAAAAASTPAAAPVGDDETPHDDSSSSQLASLLQVEWYVVGGICMKQHSAPVLADIMRAFFSTTNTTSTTVAAANPSSTLHTPAASIGGNIFSLGSSTSENGSLRFAPIVPQAHVEQQSASRERPLLATAVQLHHLLLATSSSTSTEAQWTTNGWPSIDPATITLEHRLREDGTCFWSFNTRIDTWDMDTRKPSPRYAFAVCWGLLLNVRTGACWPVSVKPGTRGYPAARLRCLACSPYHWICPLETDAVVATRAVQGTTASTVAAATTTTFATYAGERISMASSCYCLQGVRVVENTSPSLAGAEVVNDNARGLWSVSAAAQESGSSAVTAAAAAAAASGASAGIKLITLGWYVRECLDVLMQWQRQRRRRGENDAAVGYGWRWNKNDLDAPTHAKRKQQQQWQNSRSVTCFPLLVRRAAGWSRLEGEAPPDEVPDDVFLQFSTTPHCEPPDFGLCMRQRLKDLLSLAPEEFFFPGADGLLLR